MGVHSLIKAALHPGTTLQHHGEKIVPVDALHALAIAPERGSVLIHARLGQDNMPLLKAVVWQVAMEVFAQRGWEINARPRYTRQQTLDMFVEQVWREYLGEPCRRCKGHGYVGRKYDTIRHRLGICATCQGRGFVMWQTKSLSVQTRSTLAMRKPCGTCRGKRLVEISEEVKARRLKSCPVCWGSGAMPATVRALARALHMDNKWVKRSWIERFRAVLATLRGFEAEAMIVCKEFLFGEEN